MSKRKIIINASYAGKKPTGIGVFTKEIVSNLIKMKPDLFFLLCQRNFVDNYEYKKIISRYYSPEYGIKAHISRILWSQSILAFEYMRMGGSLLFSTLPESPIFINNKVVVVHDIIPAKFKQTNMKYYYFTIVPMILKTSRHIVFVSENTRREVFDYYKLKDIPNSVIYEGYNQSLFYPIEKGFIKKKYGFDRYFLYVGDMRPYKNLENAIRSFARAELKDVFFVIAGKKDKRYFPGIKKLIEDLNLGSKVIFTDYIPKEELPHYYRDSIALFFPSKYEGFGLPPLEAMATGTPVITTSMTSIPEVCGNAALYVDPDNINEMASALKRLAMDASLRESYSRASLQRASQFGWEKAAEEYMDLLLGILDEV